MCVRDSEVLAVFLTGAFIRPGRVSAALCAHSAFPAPAPSRPPDTALAEKSPLRPSIPPQDATLYYSVLVNEPFVEQLSVHSKVEWEVQRFRSHPHPLRHPASTICAPPPPSAPQLRCLHPVSAIHTPLHHLHSSPVASHAARGPARHSRPEATVCIRAPAGAAFCEL